MGRVFQNENFSFFIIFFCKAGRRGGGGGSDEGRLRLAAVAHVALEALALAGRVVALAAAAALERVVVGRLRLRDAREDVRVRASLRLQEVYGIPVGGCLSSG